MRKLAYLIVPVLGVLCWPASASAQTPLSEILVKLIQNDVTLAPPPAGLSHATHFIPGEQEKLAPYLFNQAIASQLTTFPLGSSSGGFTYVYDPTVRSFTRASETFGPAFADRALTLGKGKFSLGGNYQYSSYSSFEGKNIDDDSIKFYLTHENVGGAFFEGDVIQTALRLSLKTNTFSMFANYGVTDRLDVGIAVPFVSVKMNADIDAKVLRFATEGQNPPIHVFQNGTDSSTFSDSGSASGVGDIVLRAKYRFHDFAGGGLGASVDLRLPTGDEANLLGSGATQTRVQLIGSGAANRFAPHFNVGYTFTGSSNAEFFDPSDEFNYTFGTELLGTPRLTVNADVVGRTLRGSGRLVEQPRTFTYNNPLKGPGSTTVSEFASQAGNLNLLMGGFGVKFNPTGNLLISGNVLVPFNKAGIKANLTPVIGVDYVF